MDLGSQRLPTPYSQECGFYLPFPLPGAAQGTQPWERDAVWGTSAHCTWLNLVRVSIETFKIWQAGAGIHSSCCPCMYAALACETHHLPTWKGLPLQGLVLGYPQEGKLTEPAQAQTTSKWKRQKHSEVCALNHLTIWPPLFSCLPTSSGKAAPTNSSNPLLFLRGRGLRRTLQNPCSDERQSFLGPDFSPGSDTM